jgi:hypothetical protein
MHIFIGLLKKDLKISQTFFYSFLILIGIVIATSLGFAQYYKMYEIVTAISCGLVVAHFVYIPGSILFALLIEGKTQLWLHNPNSSRILLLSKLISSLIFHVISLFISLIIASISLKIPGAHISKLFGVSDLLYMGVWITFLSLYISFWVICYWTIYHSLARVTWMKKTRWIFLIVIWNVWNGVSYFVNKLTFIQEIKKMGMVKIGNMFHLEANDSSFTAGFETADVSLIVLAGYLCIAIIIFLCSSWLLDKKVEV